MRRLRGSDLEACVLMCSRKGMSRQLGGEAWQGSNRSSISCWGSTETGLCGLFVMAQLWAVGYGSTCAVTLMGELELRSDALPEKCCCSWLSGMRGDDGLLAVKLVIALSPRCSIANLSYMRAASSSLHGQ